MKRYRGIDYIIGIIILIIQLGIGIYICNVKGIVMGDNAARVANGFYVLFIHPKKFASIGLVWTPLPSMLALPFIILSKWYKPLVTSCLAGVIVTALCQGAIGTLLSSTFRKFNIPIFYKVALMTVYLLNPFIAFYGANGMSETVFFVFMVYMMINMSEWIKEKSPMYLMKVGFALSLMFFCRYEAMPIAVGIGCGIILILLFDPKERTIFPKRSIKEKYYYIEATELVIFTPLLYSIFIWIIFNWAISGEPLYFLNSAYSNAAHAGMTLDRGNAYETLIFVFQRTLPFIIPFIGVLAIRIVNKSLFRVDLLMLICVIVAIVSFHYLMLLKQQSYGWVRFFSYVLPLLIAWAPYELSNLVGLRRAVSGILLICSFCISGVLTGKALYNPDIAVEEQGSSTRYESEKVADYINENLYDATILLDCFAMGDVIMGLDQTDHLITSMHDDFKKCLNNPSGNGVEYIVIPNQEHASALNAINEKYPQMYEEKLEWCTLELAYDYYKIFKVIE